MLKKEDHPFMLFKNLNCLVYSISFTYAALAGIPVHPQQGRWSGHEHGRHKGSYNVETVNDTYSSI